MPLTIGRNRLRIAPRTGLPNEGIRTRFTR